MVGLLLTASLLSSPVAAANSEDSEIFIAGFNAYQKRDYAAAVQKMKAVLDTYPDTPLRDMAIFWLARASFKAGNNADAAKHMSQFMREYPDSPLKSTVEDELLALVAKFDKGIALPAGSETATVKTPAVDQATAKAAAEKVAREKAEAEKREVSRLAQEKAAAERLATEKAEAERLAGEKRKADAERIAQEKAAEENRAIQLAAQAKAESERLAAEKAARLTAEAERLAAIEAARKKAEAERVAQEKVEQEKAEVERREVERLARVKAEAEKQAAEKAALIKAEAERVAAEKAAAEKAAMAKAAAEKAAAEKAALEKAAAEKAASEVAEAERRAAEKSLEEARFAAEKAASERREKEKLAARQSMEEKAAAQRRAEEQTAREKAAAELAAQQKATRDKEEAERSAALKIAKEKAEAEQLAARQALARKPELVAVQKEPRPAAESTAMRQKAINEFRTVAEKYPGTKAAQAAMDKLRELGVPYVPAERKVDRAPAPSQPVAAVVPGAQVLSLEVEQNASLDFTLNASGRVFEVGKRHEIPFEVVNRGNGTDSMTLDSGFPPEFNAAFVSAEDKSVAIAATPSLAPGQRYKGVLLVTVPGSNIDGQKILHPVKATSNYAREISQSRDVYMVSSAPLLRTVIKSDKGLIIPGDRVVYRLVLLNIGTATAQSVTMKLNFPAQYEPVSSSESGFRQEGKSALALDSIRIDSGESKEFHVAFQLKDDAVAQQELFCRADIINNELQTRDSFLSSAAFVQAVSGVSVKINTDKLTVIPGQVVSIPLIINNTGNIRDDFYIKPVIHGNLTYSFYHDLNRDGIRQSNEPLINHVGPLSPKEQAYVVLEIATSADSADGSEAPFSVIFEPESDRGRMNTVKSRLVYSRPVVDMVMAARGGKLKPGEISSFDLNFSNRGSNMAKSVELHSAFPADLELLASEPSFSRVGNGEYLWRFDELGAGEKRNIKVTFRVKSGTAVGTSMQVRNILNYQDQLGNRY